MENQISREVAESDFDRFAKFARLKMDRVRNLNEKTDVEELRAFVVDEIVDGRITVDDGGRVTIRTESAETPEVKFVHRPFGTIIKAMDMQKTGQDGAKQLAAIAETCGISKAKLEALEYRDLANVQVIFSMFLV